MVTRYYGKMAVVLPPYTEQERAEEMDFYDRMAGTGKYAGRAMVIAHSKPRGADPAGAATSPQTAAASPAPAEAVSAADPPKGKGPRRRRS
jgi:hypothetical protein